VGAPRPPPYPVPSRLCFLQGLPSPPRPFFNSGSCLFSCPFLSSFCLKDKCFLFPCAVPISSCLALLRPLPPARSPPRPRNSNAFLAALSQPPLPRSCLFCKGPQQNQALGEKSGANSQLGHFMHWTWAGSPHYTRTYLQQSQFIPPPAAVSVEKCQDSVQGSEPRCRWEPSRPSRAGSSAYTPCLTAGSGEHTRALYPRLVSPHLLQVKAPGKNWSKASGFTSLALAAGQSTCLAQAVRQPCWGSIFCWAGAQVTWQWEACVDNGKVERCQWWWCHHHMSRSSQRFAGHSGSLPGSRIIQLCRREIQDLRLLHGHRSPG